MPADRSLLLTAVQDGLLRLGGAQVDLSAVPLECPLIDLDAHGIELDSIQLLELVVLLEVELGCDLDLPEVTDDWQSYTWGRLLDDLAEAAGR